MGGGVRDVVKSVVVRVVKSVVGVVVVVPFVGVEGLEVVAPNAAAIVDPTTPAPAPRPTDVDGGTREGCDVEEGEEFRPTVSARSWASRASPRTREPSSTRA